MRGAWAGELGQTQFMPSAYLKYGVTANGGRGGDLIGNSADALASTANFLHAHGWQRGAGWDEGQPNFAALLEWNARPGLRQDDRRIRRPARGAVAGRRGGAQLPNTSFVCAVTRTKVVRLETSLRWAAPI